MNAPTIVYLPPDRRHVAACPNVPEFSLSPHGPRYLSRAALCIKCEQPIHEKRGERNHIYLGNEGPYCRDCADAHNYPQHGPMVPPMISNPRKVHEPIEVGTREHKWMNLQPLSIKRAPLMESGFVAPMHSLKGLDWWEAAIAKIARLTDQQARDDASRRILIESDKEIPLIVDEFRANGFEAISLSSSQRTTDDDEIEAGAIAEHHLNMVPYGYGPKRDEDGNPMYNPYGFPLYNSAEDIVPIMRRIEWEQNEARNSPIVRIRLEPAPDGTVQGVYDQPWMAKMLDAQTFMRMVVRIAKRSGLMTAEDLIAARDWQEHYGKDLVYKGKTYKNAIGSILRGVTTGYSYPEQSHDDLDADEYNVPKKERHLPPEKRTAALRANGERELGLHGDVNDEVYAELNALGVLFIGHMPDSVTGRGHDDPFSFDSYIWMEAQNGLPWSGASV